MISYPIKPWCRVLEAAHKHDFCSVLLSHDTPTTFTMFPLVKCFLSVTRLGCDWWAAGWGHRGAPDPLSSSCTVPQPSWHRMEPCPVPSTPTPRHKRSYFPGLTLGLQNDNVLSLILGMWGCSINFNSSCKDPSARVGSDTSAPRHRGELAWCYCVCQACPHLAH